MRIGVIFEPYANAYYRAVYPVEAMRRRGHDVVWPPAGGLSDEERLRGCHVVHVYRRGAADTQRVVAELARQGTAIVYDNDDDFTTVPEESPTYKLVGGPTGQRVFMETVNMAKFAQVFTTTTETLANRYRHAGVGQIEVIGNHLSPDPRPQRPPHQGVVIGWLAGIDHAADTARIHIAEALRALVEKHFEVRVECIGVDLALPERYRHDRFVKFDELPSRMAGWDIGIAPLADIPFNRCRSDIKLKEYAASGVPWLASPVGPYTGLGPKQGGRLVCDDGWFEALDGLVGDHRDRERLARSGEAWARRQTIEAAADQWERVFAEAAGWQSRPG